MNPNNVDESNQHEVDLAFKTLEFIEQLKDSEIPAEVLPKMRDVIANISDFQFRFAAPMDLPMGFGRPQDMTRFLPTPKPINVLLKYKFAYPVEDNRNTMRQDDGVIVDGKIYCFAGKDTWKSLVDSGKLTGDDAKSPNVKSADWMKDLFAIFKHVSAEHKHAARRLAACWYHIATQIDYEASPEDEEEEAETAATMQEAGLSFLSLMTGPQGMAMMDDEDEDADEDFNPDDEDEGEEDGESDEEDAEIDDAEDEGDDAAEGEEKEKEEKSNREEKEKEEKSNNEDDDDAEGDEEDGEFDEEDEDVEFSEREISPEEQAYRKAILDAVESLNAYMPSPSEDMAWFKRALKAMSMAPMMGLTDWYPFGIPPLEPLKRCAESADEQEKQYASTILKIYERLA